MMNILLKLSVFGLAALIALSQGVNAGSLQSPGGIAVGDDPLVWTGDHTFDGLMGMGTDEVFGSGDATPDVSTGSLWTSNATGVTITDFDGTPVDGQLLYVRSGGATVYDCTGAGLDCGTADFTTAAGHLTVWMYDGTNWDRLAWFQSDVDLAGFLPLSGGSLSGDLTMGAGVQILVDDGSAAAPALVRKDTVDATAGGLFFKTLSDADTLTYAQNSVSRFSFQGNNFFGEVVEGPRILNETASETNPNLTSRRDDADTGQGAAALDQLSLIAGAIEGIRIEEASSQILIKYNVHAGLTASTTQTQGQGALLSSYNEIATVANANDTVTLPTAAAGYRVVIVNNGANTLRIFPASGDNLGAGADTATTLAAGANVTYFAYDATNWESI